MNVQDQNIAVIENIRWYRLNGWLNGEMIEILSRTDAAIRIAILSVDIMYNNTNYNTLLNQ